MQFRDGNLNCLAAYNPNISNDALVEPRRWDFGNTSLVKILAS